MASKVKVAVGVAGGLLGLGLVTVGGAWMWAGSRADAYLGKTFETHTVDFAIPFPLTDAEIEAIRAERTPPATLTGTDVPADAVHAIADAATAADPMDGVDLQAIALERAVARGKHLVESRYVCIECHGQDFGGGTMIDDPMIGTLKGKNLTTGKGSVTASYEPADWDRAVRHGVAPDGTPLAMPSEDFFGMSDRELSDVIAYIQTMPPVDAEIPDPVLGPLGTVLMAAGQIKLSAYGPIDHTAAHAVEAPDAAATPEFGKHLAQVCTGCHNADFTGGKMAGGDPSWPPIANITPHEHGLAGWAYEDFDKMMRTAVRPDGSSAAVPMSTVIPYTSKMTETEMQALWAYLQTIEPKPDPS